MNKAIRRLPLALKAAHQLGLGRVFWFAVYQIGLHSGYYRIKSPIGSYQDLSIPVDSPFHPPTREHLSALLRPEQRDETIAEADIIAAGQAHLFGGPLVDFSLHPPGSSQHWTAYEDHPATGVEDLKFIWEPARFGWVYLLARAYVLNADERYPEVFWNRLEEFLHANPPNSGPNWCSAQEVALRLLALLFASRVFASSQHTTSSRTAQLAGVIATHAKRIPLTLSYARAQNNNHLITEALGLYAAGCALPGTPSSRYWKHLGWRWLNRAFQDQIQPDGSYTQHSMNYHRLMLHAALQSTLFNQPFPQQTSVRLAAATTWLLAQIDPASGHAPNLGSNDGACILPLSADWFADYRPVAQAASRAFLGRPAFPPGHWDELGLWLGQDVTSVQPKFLPPSSPAVHRLGDADSWGTLRAVRFKQRPSHADQLHVDLWWKGKNIALDAGTFRYTAEPPWENSLARTAVHNTITVNEQDQMLRAGRFLWLDWAQADVVSSQADAVIAQHYGYIRYGVLHRRELKRAAPGHWLVTDDLQQPQPAPFNPTHGRSNTYTLHWLLPDWPWKFAGSTLILEHPMGGRIVLEVTATFPKDDFSVKSALRLTRAGIVLVGEVGFFPTLGWYSSTYNDRAPALALTLSVQSTLPVQFVSVWDLQG